MSIASGAAVEEYRVQTLLGAGAMGEVYLAIDEGLGRRVALKILSDAHRDNPELRARFIREARAVAAISHPNVVQVFSIGEHDGRPYFAMEYLAGKDLGTIVRASGAMQSTMASAALLDSARGLQAAAEAGLIHRDVKPSNLVKLDLGPVKVTDFGLAKPAQPTDDPALTALGVVVGTPDYIAPEQARGDAIDSRVDVYALGCTAYFLLTGKPPFRKGSDDDDKYIKVVARHLRDPAPDARVLAPGTDDDLAELALAMMAKVADDRPGYPQVISQLETIHARLRAGMPAAPRRRTAASDSGRGGAASANAGKTPSDPSAMSSLPIVHRGRARWLWLTTAAAVIVFGVGLGLTLFGAKTPPGSPAPDARPAASASASMPTSSAAVSGASVTTSAAAVEPHGDPTPPPGMLLVRRADGRPWFFVDRAPVTNQDYAEMIGSHHYRPDEEDVWVQGIAFGAARSYAKLRGKRLLHDDEWDAALNTLGFVPAGMRTWEWVDDGAENDRERPVRRVEGGKGKRPARGDKSIAFRLARDLK